jgi:hypothetical protein
MRVVSQYGGNEQAKGKINRTLNKKEKNMKIISRKNKL